MKKDLSGHPLESFPLFPTKSKKKIQQHNLHYPNKQKL
jgi:hypothetical protein